MRISVILSKNSYNMRYRLTGYDVEIITPKDLGIHIVVDESGSTPIENARLKG